MANITAIGAHPDDIEIFMYGTLAAFREQGDRLSLIVATDGAKGTVGGGAGGKPLAARRVEETRRGLARLGLPQLLNLPDGRLADTAGAADKIATALAATSPDLILTHAPEDYHPDHRALAGMVADGAGFMAPVLYADTLLGVGFAPQYYVDITQYADEKEAAIMAHESQQPERFAAAAALMNGYRAAQCNAPPSAGHRAEAWRQEVRFPFADSIRALLPPALPLRPFYVAGSDGLI